MQVAGLELVAVATDVEQPHAVAVQLRQPAFRADGDRHHLPRDGVAVLESGRADFADGYVEAARDLADEVFGPHVALLDPEIEEISLARRRVGGDFLDLEILGDGLDAAADAGQVGGEQRRRTEGVEGHECDSVTIG